MKHFSTLLFTLLTSISLLTHPMKRNESQFIGGLVSLGALACLATKPDSSTFLYDTSRRFFGPRGNDSYQGNFKFKNYTLKCIPDELGKQRPKNDIPYTARSFSHPTSVFPLFGVAESTDPLIGKKIHDAILREHAPTLREYYLTKKRDFKSLVPSVVISTLQQMTDRRFFNRRAPQMNSAVVTMFDTSGKLHIFNTHPDFTKPVLLKQEQESTLEDNHQEIETSEDNVVIMISPQTFKNETTQNSAIQFGKDVKQGTFNKLKQDGNAFWRYRAKSDGHNKEIITDSNNNQQKEWLVPNFVDKVKEEKDKKKIKNHLVHAIHISQRKKIIKNKLIKN